MSEVSTGMPSDHASTTGMFVGPKKVGDDATAAAVQGGHVVIRDVPEDRSLAAELPGGLATSAKVRSRCSSPTSRP